MQLLYESDLKKNTGGDNKHEITLTLLLLLLLRSDIFENEDEIIDTT